MESVSPSHKVAWPTLMESHFLAAAIAICAEQLFTKLDL